MTELSLHILDIVQNSISAKASVVEIVVSESQEFDRLVIEIIDNGKGMDKKSAENAIDPYFTSRTTRKVGMGLPLFKASTEQCDGSFELNSGIGIGTRVKATYMLSHIDRQPMGDTAGVIVLLAASNPALRFVYKHTTQKGEYRFDTNEVHEILGNVSISNVEIKRYLKEMIEENLIDIKSQI